MAASPSCWSRCHAALRARMMRSSALTLTLRLQLLVYCRWGLHAHTCNQVLSAAVFTFTVSISVQPSLQAPDVVWCTARWKGCDPGPTDVRDGGINWPNSDHQMQMSATCLRRWRALRAAHDIMWGDPMTTAFAELPDTQVMTRRAPFAAVKQCNSLCRGCWRRCLMVF